MHNVATFTIAPTLPMPKLPTLVFAENHFDPATFNVFKKLLPVLKELGYEVFLDEQLPSLTLENYIEEIEKMKKIWVETADKFKKFNLDISDPSTLKHYFFSTDLGKEYAYFIKEYPANLVRLEFLISMKSSTVKYQGIDSKADENDENREKIMASTYLNSRRAFGRIGSYHVVPIQDLILEKISYEQASAEFCFFEIHSPLSTTVSLGQQINQGKLQLPLGIISLDAALLNVDEMLQLILKNISLKQEKAQKATAKPSSSILYRFFNLAFSCRKPAESKSLVLKPKSTI